MLSMIAVVCVASWMRRLPTMSMSSSSSAARLVEALGGGVGFGGFGDLRERRALRLDRGAVGIERLFAEQELHGALGNRIRGLGRLAVEILDQRVVGIAELAQADDFAAAQAQVGELMDEAADVIRAGGTHGGEKLGRGGAHFLGARGRRLAEALDFVELVDGGVGGGVDGIQRLGQPLGVLFLEPEIPIEHLAGAAHEFEIDVGVGVALA